VVLWEHFDLLEKSTGNVYGALSAHMAETEEYISLIFHRFLSKNDKSGIKIKINNYHIEGLDPFLESHNKTNIKREIRIMIPDSQGIDQAVVVQPYILPFQCKQGSCVYLRGIANILLKTGSSARR